MGEEGADVTTLPDQLPWTGVTDLAPEECTLVSKAEASCFIWVQMKPVAGWTFMARGQSQKRGHEER